MTSLGRSVASLVVPCIESLAALAADTDPLVSTTATDALKCATDTFSSSPISHRQSTTLPTNANTNVNTTPITNSPNTDNTKVSKKIDRNSNDKSCNNKIDMDDAHTLQNVCATVRRSCCSCSCTVPAKAASNSLLQPVTYGGVQSKSVHCRDIKSPCNDLVSESQCTDTLSKFINTQSQCTDTQSQSIRSDQLPPELQTALQERFCLAVQRLPSVARGSGE